MRVRVRISRAWAVDARVTVRLPVPLAVVRPLIEDWRELVTHDAFHRRIRPAVGLAEAAIRVGDEVVIEHRGWGVGIDRRGRLLWREVNGPRVGFAFSDLSRANTQKGFPHVVRYELASAGDTACRLDITVRGRWTLHAVGRVGAWGWVGWIMLRIGLAVELHLLRTLLREARDVAVASGGGLDRVTGDMK